MSLAVRRLAIRRPTNLFHLGHKVKIRRRRHLRASRATMKRPAERSRARRVMGGTRLELVTSTMSTWRSNQLS
jgi:hypothetical protein